MYIMNAVSVLVINQAFARCSLHRRCNLAFLLSERIPDTLLFRHLDVSGTHASWDKSYASPSFNSQSIIAFVDDNRAFAPSPMLNWTAYIIYIPNM